MPCPLRSHKVITPNKYQLFFPNQLIAINNTVSAWLFNSVLTSSLPLTKLSHKVHSCNHNSAQKPHTKIIYQTFFLSNSVSPLSSLSLHCCSSFCHSAGVPESPGGQCRQWFPVLAPPIPGLVCD